MNAADRRRLTSVLGIVAVAVALLLAALWAGVGRGVHWGSEVSNAQLPPAGSVTPPPTVPAVGHYAAVWQKPLFSPSRSPEAAAGGAGAAAGDLQLTGVILLPGLRMAMLHDRASNKDYRVIEGQSSTDGAPALVELKPRSAIVESSGARLQLQLIPAHAPESGAAPGPDGDPDDGAASAAPVPTAASGASAMVTRRAAPDGGSARTSAAGATQLSARARALKARIEAQRERQSHGGG